MPAFAQTRPWRVRVISTPRSARITSLLSSSIELHQARVLVELRGQRHGTSEGSTSVERALCPRPSTRPSGRPRARRRRDLQRTRGPRHRRSARPRSAPGSISGMPGIAAASSGSGAQALAECRRLRVSGRGCARSAAARPACAAPARARAPGRRSARRGRRRVDVEHERRHRLDGVTQAAALRLLDVAPQRVRAELRLELRRGSISSAFVPLPWRSGTITTSTSPARCR